MSVERMIVMGQRVVFGLQIFLILSRSAQPTPELDPRRGGRRFRNSGSFSLTSGRVQKFRRPRPQ